MVAGDFLEVYGNEEYFSSQDCVVTCFFIDCAHNIVEFIELIHKVLKPGGKWINFGPLLYHFADFRNEVSIEPSYDIVKGVIQKSGFEFQNEKTIDMQNLKLIATLFDDKTMPIIHFYGSRII